MSALTLLSVIAPAVPNVPQGPSGEAVTGFGDLLATLSGEDAGASGAKTPAEPTKSDDQQVEAQVYAPAVAGFLAAPTPPVLPAAEESTSMTGAVPAPADAAKDPGEAATLLLADKASTSKPIEPEVLPREQTTTPMLADKGSAAKPPRPEVQPPLPDVPTGETSETQLTLAETAAAREAAEARARTGAAPTPLTLPPAVVSNWRASPSRSSSSTFSRCSGANC